MDRRLTRRLTRRLAACAAVVALAPLVPGVGGPAAEAAPDDSGTVVPVSVAGLVNNNGIGVAPGDANIGGSGYGFPAEQFPTGTTTVDGIPYELPAAQTAGAQDNVVALGYDGAPLHWTKQGGNLVIDVPPAAADTGEYAWTFKITW